MRKRSGFRADRKNPSHGRETVDEKDFWVGAERSAYFWAGDPTPMEEVLYFSVTVLSPNTALYAAS